MGRNATEIERAVTRTLRDSLEKLQRNTEEVNQAVGDLVSACASARPSNTLPHMLRAQTAAASLAASLDVLSRFITAALQPGWSVPFAQTETPAEAEISPAAEAEPQLAAAPIEPFAPPEPPPAPTAFEPAVEIEPEPAAVEEALRTVASETAASEQAARAAPEPVQVVAPEPEARVQIPDVQNALELVQQAEPQALQEPAAPVAEQAPSVPEVQASRPVLERRVFDLSSLPPDQQELHRRANRVAKVSMQDIKMLRPADVRAGKENNDLCLRLRDDIERAHKEYERRFHAILGHPVDYFYAWMVEILGEGDPRSLGEYPYPSPVARR
jgi:pyruvate/2-oxoglutarate dehydrogenase complex dihydrolipoamide acyltransferase (E2) component